MNKDNKEIMEEFEKIYFVTEEGLIVSLNERKLPKFEMSEKLLEDMEKFLLQKLEEKDKFYNQCLKEERKLLEAMDKGYQDKFKMALPEELDYTYRMESHRKFDEGTGWKNCLEQIKSNWNK